jgi:NAD(P)-dependent dehydrogenase (short-subunit alcohol dehydrogenase family)
VGVFSELFETTVSVFGSLDIVFSNAGFMNDRFWELEVDVNLVSQITIYIHINSYDIRFCLMFICFNIAYIILNSVQCCMYCNSNYRSAAVREAYAV